MWKVLFILIVVQLSCCIEFTESLATTTATATATATATKSNVLSQKKVVVIGGGPVGLYFAALLLHKDPTVNIEILEKEKQTRSINAFGLGIGTRMQHRLSDVPGLKEKLLESTVDLPSLNIPMISRDDLSEQMKVFLEEQQYPNCQLNYGTACDSVDFDNKQITTQDGTIIEYDLLVAADGVNSKIRQQLVTEHGFHEERYLQDSSWKALTLPAQPETEAGSFKPLQHPSLITGRVLPKAPDGHTLLLLWNGIHKENPTGIDSVEDFRTMITDAMQDKNRKVNIVRKIAGFGKSDDINKDRKVVFDDAALGDCFEARPGRVHYLRTSHYHYDDSVALIGDSAHSFNSLLGQGCATGLESTHTLVESLLLDNNNNNTTMKEALARYTDCASVEAHAITDLSLLSYAINGGKRMSLKSFPLLILNMLRGKSMIQRLSDVTVPYSQIAKENALLLQVCQREFEKKRIPY